MTPYPVLISINLPEERDYEIVFQSLTEVGACLHGHGFRDQRVLVVTDSNVAPLYLQKVTTALESASFQVESFVIPAGEQSKNRKELQRLYDWALNLTIDRNTPLLTLGGGVVGDLGGYAAATLLRGLPLIHIPTSLIAQVDASIGGKTGINHTLGKNLIGSFYQPKLVLTDTSTLSTLPEREYTSGLSEVVKHALIADRPFFSWLHEHWPQILERDEQLLPELVQRTAVIKARIVELDERESGVRMILNFGHTFGHALERMAEYGSITHGEAVAVGMKAALYLSREINDFGRAVELVERIPYPPTLPAIKVDALLSVMAVDKKRCADGLRVVLLNDIGSAHVADGIRENAIRDAWTFALDRER